MNNVLYAIAVLGGLGAFFGLILAVASKVFYVKVDEREEAVTGCLNGANCGACGYAGCAAYAAAIVRDGAPIDKCAPAGNEGAKKIAAVMGVEAQEKERMVAFVKCSGGDKAQVKYAYDGVRDCALAAQAIGGGPRACAAGCLGYGNCVAACKFGALYIVDGVARVHHRLCTGCLACVDKCPKHLIVAIPYTAFGTIACNNTDKGGITRKVCENGCLGCKLCEKNCPHNAITIVDNLSIKDYSKCYSCGICAEKCPRKLIFFPPSMVFHKEG